MGNKVINQHYVAQSYLAAFTSEKEQVYVFDKVTRKVFPTGIRNVASEREFNDYSATLDPADAANFQIIEKKLSEIEGQGARITKVLLRLIKNRTSFKTTNAVVVPYKPLRNLAMLTALQLVRTKESREFARDVYTKLGTSLMKATARDVAPDVDPNNLAMEYSEDYIKWQHLQSMFEMAPDLAKTLLTRLFYVGVNRTSIPFWTSDNPVVRDAQAVQTWAPIDGLTSPFMKVIYPLSPEVALFFVDPDGFKHLQDWHCKPRLLSKSEVIHLNELQVKQSYQRVFSSEPKFERAQMLCTENTAITDPKRSRYKFYPHREEAFLKEMLHTIKDEEYETVVADIRSRTGADKK
jgi:hypothetical protein